jgi:hypothetical protein
MADAFERYLASALAPHGRLPDRRFVASVQARILLDEQLRRNRRRIAASLGKQIAALLAVAAGVWVIGRAAPVAAFFDRSPPLGLALLIAGFAFVIALVSERAATEPSASWRL